MKLCAKVRGDMGQTSHKVGLIQSDGSMIAESFPAASSVEIVDESTGVYLFRYGLDGICVGDTWHETIEDAKKQAEFEYGIQEQDWCFAEKRNNSVESH